LRALTRLLDPGDDGPKSGCRHDDHAMQLREQPSQRHQHQQHPQLGAGTLNSVLAYGDPSGIGAASVETASVCQDIP